MGTKLEEAFNLRPIAEAKAEQAEQAEQPETDEHDDAKESKKNAVTVEEATEHSVRLVNALSATEKIDHALTVVAGLNEHDQEMDDIAKEALESYTELKELGMNMSDAHSGRIMEVAASMLGIALNARDAKVTRKLKTIELQLKKLRLEKEFKDDDGDDIVAPGISKHFDRNQLLKSLRELKSADKDKE